MVSTTPVGHMFRTWRSGGGMDYYFERWLDHQGEHFRCQTSDLVHIAYELNPGVPFIQWCTKVITECDPG